MNRRDEFLAAARSQINRGIYVWGGNGENLLVMSDPIAWIKKRETTKANAERAIALFEKRKDKGVAPIQAFDCSGLVYWSQKKADVGYGDLNANSYWKDNQYTNFRQDFDQDIMKKVQEILKSL